MFNEKIILGLTSLSEGFASLSEGLKELMTSNDIKSSGCSCSCSTDSKLEETTATEETPSEVKVSSSNKPKSVSTSKAKKSEPASNELSEDELNGMTYNAIKKLAKELGISAVGNRKELIKKILAADTSEADKEEASDEIEEVTETKKSAPKTAAKKSLSKTKVEEPVEEEPEDEEDEAEEVDPVEARILEATEDMSDDEIRELLEDVGVSSKGKRQSLITKLVAAVDDGLIDLDDEEESSDSKTEEVEEPADITEGMTKKRKKAYEELCDETTEAFESGEITRDDLISFINAFNGTDETFKKVTDEELMTKYLELSAMLVDDEGDVVEEGAYFINEEPYCCGHPLHFDEDSNKFVCDCCGSEYEAE